MRNLYTLQTDKMDLLFDVLYEVVKPFCKEHNIPIVDNFYFPLKRSELTMLTLMCPADVKVIFYMTVPADEYYAEEIQKRHEENI